ncbi:hypothetical protein [Micromonospora inyonensis]|uniref:Ig-like domain (Group 3) n=1 Tax=Micromonospora inyonensis TaxID=47866 RepID=A0A1C6RH36_9ACTN|nr:hypothetical protein [Micromonospora inyonensis]SCL16485.1 hypothetical protein GA0074694_1636 [Micromonospora inyonensis]
MAVPTVTASLDAATYAPGDQMLLTVAYADTDTQPLTVTITVTDARGNHSTPVIVPIVVDPLTVTVHDDSGRSWTRVSDTGAVVVFRAVA